MTVTRYFRNGGKLHGGKKMQISPETGHHPVYILHSPLHRGLVIQEKANVLMHGMVTGFWRNSHVPPAVTAKLVYHLS